VNRTLMRDRDAIVVFDGVCNFCAWGVRFILNHDEAGRIKFAPMQSPMGQELLRRNGIDPANVGTFLLAKGANVYVRSDAALEIARDLRAWRWLRIFRVVPRPLRDWMYSVIARNRYRWFGKRDACFLPTEEERARFLDMPGG
jgi:predicted DCC family thiol-disulfide oxidoreductase YuxK